MESPDFNVSYSNTTITTKAPFAVFDQPLYIAAGQMFKYLTYVFSVIGTLGNLTSFAVLSRKSMRSSSSSVYLRALAISDTGCLWMNLLAMIAQLYRAVSVIVSTWFCRWFSFIDVTFKAMSAWIVVVMTIERYVVIKFPLKAASLVSKKKSCVVIGVLCGLSMLMCVNSLWMYITEGRHCRLNQEQYGAFLKPYTVFMTAMTTFVPIVLVLVFNGLIITQIYKAHKDKKALVNRSVDHRANKKDSENSNTKQIATMLLSISITFFIFNLPTAVYGASFDYWMVWDDPYIYALAAFLQSMTYMFLLINYSTNFLLYCLTGAKFRQELKEVVFCREAHSSNRSSVTRQTTVNSSVTTTGKVRTIIKPTDKVLDPPSGESAEKPGRIKTVSADVSQVDVEVDNSGF